MKLIQGMLTGFMIFLASGLLFCAPAKQNTLSNTNQTQAVSSDTNGTNGVFLQQFYDTDSGNQNKGYKQPNPIWTTIKIIIYTAIFGAAAYFLIRFIISKGALPSTTEDQKIVDIMMNKQIGAGVYLQIVKVGPTYYLLSLSGDGARLIDKIEDRETIDFIELNKENLKPKETKFLDILTYLPINKKGDKMDFLSRQKDRLKKL